MRPPIRSPLRSLRIPLLAAACALGACRGGPHRVTFDGERCMLDGRPAQLEEVEAEQAHLAERLLARQPIQTGVTLAMLLLASATWIQKLVDILAARPARTSLGERLRAALERRRSRPVHYFGIVFSSLALLGAAGASYVYLDADKRASERALQQLQFCHLALKGADEQRALDAQRRNLDAIQSTAGSIKALVDTLPPEEQRKAEALLGQMRAALGNQHDMLARESEVAQAVQSGSAEIQKDLGALATDVGGLRPLPTRLREVEESLGRLHAQIQVPVKGGEKGPATVGEALAELRGAVAGVDGHVQAIDCAKARLPSGKTLGETLAELAARPPPACRCDCDCRPRATPDGGTR